MRQPRKLKYFVYISDAKVEMLFAQIPVRLRNRIAADLKIDLKIISASINSRASEETRYSRTALVDNFLRKHNELGTVDDPKAYFAGTMFMRWGPLYEGRIVYFGGMTDHTVIGLAGSRRHILTSAGDSEVDVGGGSGAPDLIALLRSADPNIIGAAGLGQFPDLGDQLGWAEAAAIYDASTSMTGSVQQLDFVAKRLATRSADPTSDSGHERQGFTKTILLGSPVYVAQAD
jgi:hypothetical protein